MNNTKELSITILCSGIGHALSVQKQLVNILPQDMVDNVISTTITPHYHMLSQGTSSLTTEEPAPDAPKPPEGQDDTPDLVEEWDVTPTQRSSELPAGEGKPLPASTDILEASYHIAAQYLDSLKSEYTETSATDSLIKILGPDTAVKESYDLNYYIGVIDALHRVELRENKKRGLKHTDDTIYEALKAEHPYAVKTLRM